MGLSNLVGAKILSVEENVGILFFDYEQDGVRKRMMIEGTMVIADEPIFSTEFNDLLQKLQKKVGKYKFDTNDQFTMVRQETGCDVYKNGKLFFQVTDDEIRLMRGTESPDVSNADKFVDFVLNFHWNWSTYV